MKTWFRYLKQGLASSAPADPIASPGSGGWTMYGYGSPVGGSIRIQATALQLDNSAILANGSMEKGDIEDPLYIHTVAGAADGYGYGGYNGDEIPATQAAH